MKMVFQLGWRGEGEKERKANNLVGGGGGEMLSENKTGLVDGVSDREGL